jgi:hypothetical protein
MGRIAADLGCSSFREEPKVRRLFAGGRWIRTSGSAPAATPLTDRGVKPQATAAGCHFGEILPQGATLMMALSVSFSRNWRERWTDPRTGRGAYRVW